MSALNVFLTPAAAHIFSDGAGFDNDFRVAVYSTKVISMPHLPAVFSAIGHGFVLNVLAISLQSTTARTFDELNERIGIILREYVEQTVKRDPMFGNPFIVGLAGWSAKDDRPAFLSVRNFDSPEALAFEPLPATRFVQPAQSHTMDFEIQSMSFDPENPVESGLAIVRKQRQKQFRSLFNPADKRAHHAVGAFCQHTVLTRDAIETKIVERWPDEIGKSISPAPRMAAGGVFSQ